MSDDLSKLSWLVRHSRATLAIIRQNVAFSTAVKLLFTALTVIGLASLWGAIAADVGASLLVVLNGLRLLNRGQTSPPTGGPSGGLGVSARQHRADRQGAGQGKSVSVRVDLGGCGLFDTKKHNRYNLRKNTI